MLVININDNKENKVIKDINNIFIGLSIWLRKVYKNWEKNVVEKISNYVGYHGEILWDETKPDGTPRKLLDIEKFKNLGWSAKIDLKEGISSTIENFKKDLKASKIKC